MVCLCLSQSFTESVEGGRVVDCAWGFYFAHIKCQQKNIREGRGSGICIQKAHISVFLSVIGLHVCLIVEKTR